MKYPFLIGIGKLGRQNSDGFHPVMIKPEFITVFSELEELYLIFNSDRVFYVTISERKIKDKKTWIKLKEDGIAEEQYLHKDVVIAIDAQDTESKGTSLDYLLGLPGYICG